MLRVGMHDSGADFSRSFHVVVECAVNMQSLRILPDAHNGSYKMDIETDESARRCFELLMSVCSTIYTQANTLLKYIESYNRSAAGFSFWSYSVRSTSYIPRGILGEYGFSGDLSNPDMANTFCTLMRIFINGKGHWFSYGGMYALNELSKKYRQNSVEYERHCGTPTMRILLKHLCHVCKQDAGDLKNEILKHVPIDIYGDYKNHFDLIVNTINQRIASLEACASRRDSSTEWYKSPEIAFKDRWDYIVRAVPHFEDCIKELREVLTADSSQQRTAMSSDDNVCQFLKKHGFCNTARDLKGGINNCKHILQGLLGDEEWPKCGLCKLVEGISYSFYERVMKSLVQPSCLNEGLLWFTCLVADSRQKLLFYNLRQSCLIESLTKLLRDAKLNLYVNKVTNILLILPIHTRYILTELTSQTIDYGYYEGAIFSSKYANEYVELFFKVLMDLLREVHHITRLTADGNLWNKLWLNPSEFATNKNMKKHTLTTKSHQGTKHNNKRIKNVGVELDFDDHSAYGSEVEDVTWLSINPKNDQTYATSENAALSQMWDWFMYQGFSEESIKRTIPGTEIHTLMNGLLQGNFGLQELYGHMWVVIDNVLEKLLVVPGNFKERLDWLAKLDSGDSDDYNALNQMIDRLRGMGVKGAFKAAKAFNKLVGDAASLRRLLLEDPHDFGKYSDTFCSFTAVDRYFLVLCSFIVQLEKDFKDMKTHSTKSIFAKNQCISDCTQFCNWIEGKGFQKSSLSSVTKGEALMTFLEETALENLNILKKFVRWLISTVEPGNVKDIMEWWHQLTTQKKDLIKQLRSNINTTVSEFVGNAHATEIGVVFDNYVTAIPKMYEVIKKPFPQNSYFFNAIFDEQFEVTYTKICKKTLSAMYQHCYVAKSNPYDIRKAMKAGVGAEYEADFEVLQNPLARLPLANELTAFNDEETKKINEELNTIFESVFGITNGNENRKNALEGYVAMMQGKSLIRQPDESNMALTAAVTTAVGTGAVGAGVVYFKFNALYAFFGKLLA
ncbi:sugar kinase [Babesia caballi]|uniref:Sugar kinase n=1 Tax=Babesia caballi TaxID=5871 RepID=A0AAV4LPQ5_BABCB|nr:sugar kinase [Babesia caballi]